MAGLSIRIGGDGPVVAETETDPPGWRLLVRGHEHGAGVDQRDLHQALRDLARKDRHLARVAFGVVMNCMAWEDEYTEEHGEDALTFEDWMERIERGGVTWVNDDGELETRV